MRAAGEHLIVKIPKAKEKTEGGIQLPDQTRADRSTKIQYGRILSMGGAATGRLKAELGSPGEYAIFDLYSKTPIELDPDRSSGDVVALHWSSVVATMTTEEVVSFGLQTTE